MNIQPVNIYNSLNSPNITLQRDINIKPLQYSNVISPLKCDTVSFTSVANGEPLKRLLRYGVPDFYSNITLVDSQELETLLAHKVFSKPIRNIVRTLKPYENSMFPIEKQVYRLMKRTSRTNPKMFLDEFVHKLVSQHSKQLLAQQQPIFKKLSDLAANMPKEQIIQYNKLIELTNKKLIN